jgi:hypothetical protein
MERQATSTKRQPIWSMIARSTGGNFRLIERLFS